MSHEDVERDFPPLTPERERALERAHERRHNPKAAARRSSREHEAAAKAEHEQHESERATRRQNVRSVTGTASRAQRAGFQLIKGGKVDSKGPGGTVAGVALGLVATAIAINLFRYGPAGIGYWLSAKFVNKVTVPAGKAPAKPATASAASSAQASPASPSSASSSYQIPAGAA